MRTDSNATDAHSAMRARESNRNFACRWHRRCVSRGRRFRYLSVLRQLSGPKAPRLKLSTKILCGSSVHKLNRAHDDTKDTAAVTGAEAEANEIIANSRAEIAELHGKFLRMVDEHLGRIRNGERGEPG